MRSFAQISYLTTYLQPLETGDSAHSDSLSVLVHTLPHPRKSTEVSMLMMSERVWCSPHETTIEILINFCWGWSPYLRPGRFHPLNKLDKLTVPSKANFSTFASVSDVS